MERERSAKRVEAVKQAGRKEGRKGERERKVADSSRYINRSPTSGRRDLEKTYEGGIEERLCEAGVRERGGGLEEI